MKKIAFLMGLFSLSIVTLFAQVPKNSEAVMLQAFYWNSHGETKWKQLDAQATEIGASFDYIWLPPASAAEGGGGMNMGYHPYKWNDLGSSWGNRSELTTLITNLKNAGCKAIADIVVNHRAGNSAKGDFPTDNFGDYGTFTIPNSCITKDDENATSAATDYDYNWNVSGDYWGGYAAARDLAHSKTEVRNAVKGYLKWLKNTIGFAGFRYDLVKGYDPKYTGEYNTAVSPELSVGEYYQSNYDALAGWVNGTGKKSMVFDFCFKQAMYNWGGGTDYSKLVWKDGTTDRPAGLIHNPEMRQYAITFIDNHDTATPHEWPWEYKGNIEQANAVMLSAAGIPCVFWKHWTSNKAAIKKMIATRKAMGVHSNSDVKVTSKSGYYESVATGTKGTLICRIGSWSGTPNGYTVACSGNGWAYYTSTAVNPDPTPDPTPGPTPDPTPGGTGYSLYVNGKDLYNMTDEGAWDMDPTYNQFSLTGVALKAGDSFVFYDNATGGTWGSVTVDPASIATITGSGSDFKVSSDGCYSVYLKLKWQSDNVYFGEGTDCSVAPTPTPDPTPDPDPVPTPDPTPGGSITLKVKASSLPWGNKCYLYTWDGGELGAEVKYTGEWPGTAMTLGSDGFYTYTINQSMVYAIFTDGSASGTLQTDDIQNITASTCYELSNEQHQNMLGAMVYDAIETTCPSTAIDEAYANSVSIYPNPTTGKATIIADQAVSNVTIQNLSGWTVARSYTEEIDLSNLAPAMYLVNIQFNDGNAVIKKIIKK